MCVWLEWSGVWAAEFTYVEWQGAICTVFCSQFCQASSLLEKRRGKCQSTPGVISQYGELALSHIALDPGSAVLPPEAARAVVRTNKHLQRKTNDDQARRVAEGDCNFPQRPHSQVRWSEDKPTTLPSQATLDS